jgi:hypothetical protein
LIAYNQKPRSSFLKKMKRLRETIDPTHLRWAQELQPHLKPAPDNPYLRINEDVLDDISIERDTDSKHLYELDKIDPEWSRVNANCSRIFTSRASAYYCGALYGLTLLKEIEPIGILALLYHQVGYVPIDLALTLDARLVTALAGWDGKMKDTLGVGPRFFPYYLRFSYLCNPSLFLDTVTGEQIRRAKKIKQCRYRSSILECGIADDPSLAEEMYLKLESEGKKAVIDHLGMVLPPGQRVKEYVIDQLPNYADVDLTITYDPNLLYSLYNNLDISQLTDKVILETLDIALNYTSREELVDQARDAINLESHFFFPVKRTHRTNEETLFGTPTDDLTVDMIAYGSLAHYRLYEKDEIIAAWNQQGLTRPENSSIIFETGEIHQLMEVARPRWGDAFFYLIQNHLANREDLMKGDTDRQEFISRTTEENKKKIVTFLHQVFEAGMYMRRWKGPGHPYPLRIDDTKGLSVPQESVGVALIKIRESLEKMPKDCRHLCRHLQMMDRRSGEKEPRHLPLIFHQLWEEVTCGPGGECIRSSSSTFIATAWHYLFHLFKIAVPDFDRFAVDFVT